MSNIFVNFITPNPDEVITDELRGKSFSKVRITKVSSDCHKHFTSLEIICNKLMITYRKFISCDDDFDLDIDTLVLDPGQSLDEIPTCFLNRTKYLVLKGNPTNIGVPEHLLHKIKKEAYSPLDKHDIKPNSRYVAYEVSDFKGVNFSNVSKLRIIAEFEDLIEMVRFLDFHSFLVFEELTILYKKYTCPRKDAPFFDLSWLGNIKAHKISLSDGKFIGFRKFISLTTARYVSWEPLAIHYHNSIVKDIKQELSDDAGDIENNYTLLKFSAAPVYLNLYADVSDIVCRNRIVFEQKRFAITKEAARFD